MDSLLATYASSSDDEEQQQQQQQKPKISSSKSTEPTSYFSESPRTSSVFSSIPKPKSSSSVFSSLPPPTSKTSQKNPFNLSSSDPKPKKVIQFKLPLNPSLLKPLDDDDEEEEPKKPKKETSSSTETSSLKSFFSNLPAPKNSLGLGSGLGSGQSFGGNSRRSIVETDIAESNSVTAEKNEIRAEKSEISNEQRIGDYEGNLIGGSASESLNSVGDGSNWYQGNESYGSYPDYGSYEVSNYGNYEGNYGNYDGSAASMAPATMAPITTAPEFSGVIENVTRSQGKRGRNEIPTEIVEVNQDELMKNRPREDQVKMTGIAFGPSYQPASSKGKPTKLHKRKHQIGSLYFDMKQKEMELSERRSKGFLTKAETQAKYGW